MERTTPQLLDATGLKTPTSDLAKRLLLNLKSAEADSLLTPAQKEDCALLHLFPITFPHAPRGPRLHCGFISEVPQAPCIQGDLKIVLPFPCLAALKITLFFFGVSAFYLAAHQGMVQ